MLQRFLPLRRERIHIVQLLRQQLLRRGALLLGPGTQVVLQRYLLFRLLDALPHALAARTVHTLGRGSALGVLFHDKHLTLDAMRAVQPRRRLAVTELNIVLRGHLLRLNVGHLKHLVLHDCRRGMLRFQDRFGVLAQTILDVGVLDQLYASRVLPLPRLRHRLRFGVGIVGHVPQYGQALLRLLATHVLVDVYAWIRHLEPDLLPIERLLRGVDQARYRVARHRRVVVEGLALGLLVVVGVGVRRPIDNPIIQAISLLRTARLLRFQGIPLLSHGVDFFYLLVAGVEWPDDLRLERREGFLDQRRCVLVAGY